MDDDLPKTPAWVDALLIKEGLHNEENEDTRSNDNALESLPPG